MIYDGLTLGQALRMNREAKHLTKKEVAELFGWTAMYYARFENDQLVPGKNNWDRFTFYLDITKEDVEQLVEATKAKIFHQIQSSK